MPVTFDQQSILLVDDEDFSRSMVGQMLRRIGFNEVALAVDGFEAIEVLNTRTFTAVLTDFRMPGFTGLQLLKAIRTGRTRATRNLPCAMLTSYAERNLVGLAIVLDVDTFLTKPVSLETLNKHLSRMFQYRYEPQPVDIYETVAVENAAPHLTIPVRPAAAPPEPSPPPAPPAPSLVAPPPPDGAVQVNLAEVHEDAILAQDIVGSGGILLLAKGTPFKRRYAKRLEELREVVERVWIFDKSGTAGGQ